MSFRKSCSDTSFPNPPFRSHTFPAHFSNSGSCVTPRSSMIASNSFRPGDLCTVLGSPPSRCGTTCVVRFSAPTFEIPATYRPSHFTRNLKFLYGSKRNGFCVNCAMVFSSSGRDLSRDLLQLDHHELRRLERREAHQNVHHPEVDVVLGRRLLVALDEERLTRRLPLERALPEQVVHERPDVQP